MHIYRRINYPANSQTVNTYSADQHCIQRSQQLLQQGNSAHGSNPDRQPSTAGSLQQDISVHNKPPRKRQRPNSRSHRSQQGTSAHQSRRGSDSNNNSRFHRYSDRAPAPKVSRRESDGYPPPTVYLSRGRALSLPQNPIPDQTKPP